VTGLSLFNAPAEAEARIVVRRWPGPNIGRKYSTVIPA
jgi:hypothetical protein